MATMSKIGMTLFVLLASCIEPPQQEAPEHRVGVIQQPAMTCLPPLNPIAGTNATIVVYDSTVQRGFKSERVAVSCMYDQAVTILARVQRQGTTLWHTFNDAGAGDPVVANTNTFKDYLVEGSNTQIEIQTGGTAPSTTNETEICLPTERALGM